MASTARKLLTFLVVATVFLPPGVAFSKTGRKAAGRKVAMRPVASRKWVSKLKQNSWMNKRPFQFASPLADGDRIYIGVHRGIFYAIQNRHGKKLWSFKSYGPIHAAASADSSQVYFADTKGMVYALGKEQGNLIWVTKVGGEILTKPLLFEDRLYVVNSLKELVALDRKTGAQLWRQNQGGPDRGFTVRGAADPVLGGSNILVGYSDGTLIAHSAQNGSLQWVKQLGDRFNEFHDIDSTILVAGKLAYVTSADGKLFALDSKDGTIVWQANAGSVNNVVLQEPYLYVAAGGVVHCFSSESGESLWEQDLQLPEISSPAIYGQWLVVVATKGKAYFLDRLTGDIRHSWFVKGGALSDPVIDGNHLYLLSNASRLYQFEFK